jgi:serine/threonine protein kinase
LVQPEATASAARPAPRSQSRPRRRRRLTLRARPHPIARHKQYCDRGTLRDLVKAGAFHTWLLNGAIGVDLASLVEVLLDVAYAVQYLHSLGLVHGDIKVRRTSEGGAGTREGGVGVGGGCAAPPCGLAALSSNLAPTLNPHPCPSPPQPLSPPPPQLENVLVKTDSHAKLGFVCKVGGWVG